MTFLLTVALLLLGWLVLKLVVFKVAVRHTPLRTYLTKNYFFYDERERLRVTLIEFLTLILGAPLVLALVRMLGIWT
jgi:hypothetical protein